MKKVLMLGSTVTDVIIRIDHLPHTEEDINAPSQTLSLGGCTYNASDMLRHFNIPYTLFSPIGTGIYGDFVKNALKHKNVPILISSETTPTLTEDNGCCYCFVEADGKRTFLSVRGAEYHFKTEWFHQIDVCDYDTVYVCGLDLEENCNDIMINFLEDNPSLQVYFAPGPRLNFIGVTRMNRLFALHPILHLNKDEALSYTKTSSILEAAQTLHQLTQNSLIITDSSHGAYIYENNTLHTIPAFPTQQIDTIGAGDAHIGTIIACTKKGYSLSQAVLTANCISSHVVKQCGALLPDDYFKNIILPDIH